MNLCKYGCGQEAKHQLKNGSWCCSESHNSCPACRKKNSEKTKETNKFTLNASKIRINCKYCGHDSPKTSNKRHESHCYLNPKNITLCPNCNEPIKNYKENQTCSTGCYNSLYRKGEDNGSYKHGYNIGENASEPHYRVICFNHHKKKCIICDESTIVAVHHYDGDNTNNNPENLIPLCPTHHTYWHSRHKHLIEEQVNGYRKNIQ